MLFNEVYGCYYNVIASILAKAVSGDLTDAEINTIICEKAFAESVLTIPAALRDERWPLLLRDNTTPLEHTPTMPLTTLQKRWLKALLLDARIRLFAPSEAGLEGVEPLFSLEAFVYFDRYTDGDPYEDERYISRFHTILTALRENRKLRLRFTGHLGSKQSWECIPYKLEYSSKDDKFRLLVKTPRNALTVNLARIDSCELLEPYGTDGFHPKQPKKHTLIMELTDERNALERAMLHFSHLEKETVRLDGNRYQIKLSYDREDETELLIRVLSFGPMLRVISPDSFIEKLKERLQKQTKLRAQN